MEGGRAADQQAGAAGKGSSLRQQHQQCGPPRGLAKGSQQAAPSPQPCPLPRAPGPSSQPAAGAATAAGPHLEVAVVPRDERALGAQQLALRDGLQLDVAQHVEAGHHGVLDLGGGAGHVDVPPAWGEREGGRQGERQGQKRGVGMGVCAELGGRRGRQTGMGSTAGGARRCRARAQRSFCSSAAAAAAARRACLPACLPARPGRAAHLRAGGRRGRARRRRRM